LSSDRVDLGFPVMRPATKHPDTNPVTLPQAPAGGLPASVEGWAVFLDLDGTLLDIAETPGAVEVPDRLRADLAALWRRTGGALALVTGRTMVFVDEAFPDLRLPVAGLHGAEWRDAEGRRFDCAQGAGLGAAKRLLGEKAADWPGVVVEDKGMAVAAHFRLVPQFEAAVRAFMESLTEGLGDRWLLQRGKSVVEIRPAGSDKGRAVERFMSGPPFRGRRPLAVGDDLTDEAMFSAVNRLAGLSVRVGQVSRPTAARAVVETPAAVRDWIARVSR
jgi:trehalose 6-phosphate phosphatase